MPHHQLHRGHQIEVKEIESPYRSLSWLSNAIRIFNQPSIVYRKYRGEACLPYGGAAGRKLPVCCRHDLPCKALSPIAVILKLSQGRIQGGGPTGPWPHLWRRKGGPTYILAVGPTFHPCSFSETTHLFMIFQFFHRRQGQTYPFLSKYDNGRVEPSSKFRV